MEPAADASLEPAIQWLAQSIIASPLLHEQAPWVREAGLAEEMEALESEVNRVQLVVSVIKGRAPGNEPLAKSLVRLKELLYDADDAVDELDYYRLLQLDQEDDLDQPDGHHGASQADRLIENADVPSTGDTLPDPRATDGHGTQPIETSRVRKLRSELWKEFKIIKVEQNGAPARAECKHCKAELACPTKQGTGVLQNHLKSKACPYDPLSTTDATTNPAPPVATDNLSSKKRRRDEELTSLVTANTNMWNQDDFSKMIRDITLKLHHIREGLIPVLSIFGSDLSASSNHSQGATSHQPRRTSGTLKGMVYGRESETNEIIELMEEEKNAPGATVLPILGIAGVGKTALVQLVYNYPVVKNQFDHLVWIWVSNNFNAMELTKDMLGYVSQETHVGLCNFAKLQEILESRIKSKRVLLILDDVWDGINDSEWNQLLAPFNSEDAWGNMIIVTTRKPCVAKRRGTVGRPIKLGALNSDDFWSLFTSCAFSDFNHEERESLIDLGQQIARKLKGIPLAAETAGALLSEHYTVSHWSIILEHEEWKSLTLSGGIMSSLKLCYDPLPYHLQQCLLYCSLFPCKYEFLAEELVHIWISQGFVNRNNSSKRLVEIGHDYLDALVNLGFFEQHKEELDLDCTQIPYVMCNLIHDFARVVSRTECATIDGLECNRVFPTVRHLSIISNSIYQMEDPTGNIVRIEKFEEILRNTLSSVRKLRSLVLIGPYGSSFSQFFQTAFQEARNLRLLHLSATSAGFRSFLCNLVNPAHLRYLKLKYYQDEQWDFSQVVSKSFHLQILDVDQNNNRFHLALSQENSGEPQAFPSLERLRCLTRLELRNVQTVKEVFVPSLEELVLFKMKNLKICSCTSVGDLTSSLSVLEIQSCPALEVFDLFQEVYNYETDHNSWFPSLKKLIVQDCPNLRGMIPLRPSSTVLKIKGSSLKIKQYSVLGESPCEMTLDYKFLTFHNMRGLTSLEIKNCGMVNSILLRAFGHLVSLKSLKIENSSIIRDSDEDLIPSNDGALPRLESVIVKSSQVSGKCLSLLLWHSPNLMELDLDCCSRLTQLQIEEDIQSSLISTLEASSPTYHSLTSSATAGLSRVPLNLTSSVKKITIQGCPHLILDSSSKGFAGFSSLEKLTICGSPKLLLHSVHNDGSWLLPPSLEELFIHNYSHETMVPIFVGNHTGLKKLEIASSPHLKSLQFDSCTAMGYLGISNCSSLDALEGLRSLVNLRELILVGCPVLASLATSGEGSECSQLPGLERLHISELSVLTTSFFKGLSRLQSLSLRYLREVSLTAEQERALLLHGSVQELLIFDCQYLLDLPAGLHSLHSLKSLKIKYCQGISGLPNEGLPPSLEELEIQHCSSDLSAQCRTLATDTLRVKIDGQYV